MAGDLGGVDDARDAAESVRSRFATSETARNVNITFVLMLS